jgi:hypothetical protein
MTQFEEFEAATLFCPKCKDAMPVRKRLLLVLLDGELYEYLCQGCGSSLGTKREKKQPKIIFTETNENVME